ncbi:hypothetical protein EON64_13790, partial [archaeon]
MEGQVEGALDHLVPLLQSNPNHAAANALAGALLLSLGQLEAASPFLYHALFLSNYTDYRSAVNLASLLRQQDTPYEALKILTRTYRALDNQQSLELSLVCEQLGAIFHALGRYAVSSDWYLHAAHRRPRSPDLWVWASSLRHPREHVNLRLSENVLLTAVSFNAQSPLLFYYLGLTQVWGGRGREGVALLEHALSLHRNTTSPSTSPSVPSDSRIDTTYANLLSALATAYHALGEEGAAAHYYAQATAPYLQE